MTEKLYKMMEDYTPTDTNTIQKSIVDHVEHTLARTRLDFKSLHCYQAVAHSVRDRLIEYYNDTYSSFYKEDCKKVYYFSLEFLIGRCLTNAVVNIDMQDKYKEALRDMGYSWEKIVEKEVDPALGNGGLGRLAACFLDSLATLNMPGFGYGIRYDYGIFRQTIQNGYQVEVPDFWLSEGNPWEIERVDVQYRIRFYGKTRKVVDAKGKERVYW
jgi:glycogen phosphorylase